MNGYVEFDGLAISLREIHSRQWSEYTGYKDGEGDCKIMQLHDVYEGSQDAEFQIKITGNIHNKKK